MSTAYYPETDGSSEQTNKTVIQAICFHVKHNQEGWVHTLPRVWFNIMNTVNKSTGFSPFQLRFGRRPHLLPLLVHQPGYQAQLIKHHAKAIMEQMIHDMWEAQDNLLKAKVAQAQQANKKHLNKFPFEVGQCIRLSTLHQRWEYKSQDKKRVIKFMPCYDGPYKITKIDPEHSTVTLDIPHSPRIYPVFHISEVLPFIENDESLFPSRALHEPEPVFVNNNLEYVIDRIINERKLRGHRGWTYILWDGLVKDLQTTSGYHKKN